MNRNPAIGHVGFGEAGFHIAAGLRTAGIERLYAYDIRNVRERAAQAGVNVVDSPAELAAAGDILISAVTADSAKAAATQIAPYLKSRHIYADINSISPALKQEIDKIIRASAAGFVEAAVMAPVPPYGHRVPMLLGGNGAALFAEILSPFGMQLDILSEGVGTAAAVKMCRSIVVKGLEALFLECALGASQYGASERVFASLNESFPGIDWKKLASYMIGRVAVHGERRAHEMEEVAATLRAIGIDPIMAEATARRQAWGAQENNHRDVIESMNT